mmetsp:Transcript_13676/g.33119  ORF Transcript_13676/g.33119 Transcript_13676/m.33119 type:complete len:494 (-) Transcript_13676:203-1684(-)
MEGFSLTRQLGKGAHATVWKATRKKDGKIVAVKHLNSCPDSLEECKNLPEIKALSKVVHSNIVALLQVVRQQDLFLVFEYCDFDLYRAVASYRDDGMTGMDEAVARWTMRQLLAGLQEIHKKNFVHLDLKPENVMVCFGATEVSVKIADFGQAAELRPRAIAETYVGTRWYRAPELLLGDTTAATGVDVWAAGCIFCELLLLRPLFPGDSTMSTLFQIYTTVPTATENEWPEGLRLARERNIRWPTNSVSNLGDIMPADTSAEAMSLASSLLTFNPGSRISSAAASRTAFFAKSLPETPIRKPTKREPLTREVLDQQRADVKAIMTRVQATGEPARVDAAARVSASGFRSGGQLSACASSPQFLPAASAPPSGPVGDNGQQLRGVTSQPVLVPGAPQADSSSEEDVGVPVRPKPGKRLNRRTLGRTSKFDPLAMQVEGDTSVSMDRIPPRQFAYEPGCESEDRTGFDDGKILGGETRKRREPLTIANINGDVA